MQDVFMGSWAAKHGKGCVFATLPRDSLVTLFVRACLGCWAGRQAGQKTLRRRWRDKGNVGLRPRRPVEGLMCVLK